MADLEKQALKPELGKCVRFENTKVFSKRRHFPSSGSQSLLIPVRRFANTLYFRNGGLGKAGFKSLNFENVYVTKIPWYFRDVGIFPGQDPKVLKACYIHLPFLKRQDKTNPDVVAPPIGGVFLGC